MRGFAKGLRVRNNPELLMSPTLFLPGGMPGAERLRDSKELLQLLRQQKGEGKLYAAICASPAVVFEHHGELDD